MQETPVLSAAPAQVSLEDLPERTWDVVVAGAGPAGSVAAIHLAARGRRVLLLDREAFPRDKVCGDGLIPDALGALERAGLGEEIRHLGLRLSRASVFSPSRIEISLPGNFVTLRRSILDAAIARRAVAAGAVFCRAKVADLTSDGGGGVRCRIAGREAPVTARAALVATGASVSLLRGHGVVDEERPSAIAMRCYVRSRLALDRLVISYDRSVLPGYAWIFPLRDGIYNVGCGVFDQPGRGRERGPRWNLRTLFERFAQDFPLMRDLMRHAVERTPLRGAPLRCGLRGVEPFGRGAVLAVGETVGATFPFTGEGIGKSMETAELAVEAIELLLETGDAGAVERFGERVRSELGGKYRAYRIAQGWLSRAWVCDLLARRARRSRFLRDSLAGILSETVDPRTVFSTRGVLRSLLR